MLQQDLASGYMSGKLLLKLEATGFILTHHTREHFAFLDDPANARNRTTFYYTLSRLLFMEDTPSKFKAFMAPLNKVRAAGRARPYCRAVSISGCPPLEHNCPLASQYSFWGTGDSCGFCAAHDGIQGEGWEPLEFGNGRGLAANPPLLPTAASLLVRVWLIPAFLSSTGLNRHGRACHHGPAAVHVCPKADCGGADAGS